MSWKVKAEMWKLKTAGKLRRDGQIKWTERWKLKGCTFDINSNMSRVASPRFCGFVISRLLRVADPDAHWICHIDRMGDISLWFCEIHWQCLFLASHVVQTTSAQRVTNCYKHCRTSFTTYRDDISSKNAVCGYFLIIYKAHSLRQDGIGIHHSGSF